MYTLSWNKKSKILIQMTLAFLMFYIPSDLDTVSMSYLISLAGMRYKRQN